MEDCELFNFWLKTTEKTVVMRDIGYEGHWLSLDATSITNNELGKFSFPYQIFCIVYNFGSQTFRF